MVVNYVGTERCDIVYYLLRIGKGLNVKTLAVDNSITGDLYHIFDKGEQDHVSEYGSVTVARNKLVGLEEAQEYDVVIIYEGLYPRYSNYRNITILPRRRMKVNGRCFNRSGTHYSTARYIAF